MFLELDEYKNAAIFVKISILYRKEIKHLTILLFISLV